MALLQIHVDDSFKKTLQAKAKRHGLSVSALSRLWLAKLVNTTENEGTEPGNVFNSERDNQGKGLPVDDFLALFP